MCGPSRNQGCGLGPEQQTQGSNCLGVTGLGPLKIAGDRAELKTWSPRWNGSPFPSPPTAKLQGTLPVPLGCKTNARESAVRKQYHICTAKAGTNLLIYALLPAFCFCFPPFQSGMSYPRRSITASSLPRAVVLLTSRARGLGRYKRCFLVYKRLDQCLVFQRPLCRHLSSVLFRQGGPLAQ